MFTKVVANYRQLSAGTLIIQTSNAPLTDDHRALYIYISVHHVVNKIAMMTLDSDLPQKLAFYKTQELNFRLH